MKRITIISSILIFSILSFGQENKCSIGILSSFDKFNYDFKPKKGFNHEYKTSTAYSFGLILKYNYTENIFAKGIIQYSKRGYKLEYDYNFTDPGDPHIPRETSIKSNYIGIPLFMGYHLYNKEKFKISPSLGLVTELLISDHESSIFEDDSERESDFFSYLNKVLFSSQLNMAFNYYFSDKMFLSLEPYIRIGFNAISYDVMVSNAISYGGILSINYKINTALPQKSEVKSK